MPMGFLNTRMRFHANLNCDKLWISYASCNSISPLRTACEMRKYFRKAHTIYLSQEKPFALTLKEKSPVPFVGLLFVCCTVPVWWWEALDLSRIAQPPSGAPVHRYELRRGRLWIAEVISAFYQNWRGFCAVFPKRSMKSVCCSNTWEQWWNMCEGINRVSITVQHFAPFPD